MHPADRLAFDYAMVAEPVWNRIETAQEAISLPENVLLHAGPPFAEGEEVCRPIMNSACVAGVFEGLATTLDQAEAMIMKGEIILAPAQDHGVVTPLAAVVSASMPLHAVYDAHRGHLRAFTPINGGNGPAMRLGLRSNAVLEHIRWLNTRFCDVLRKGIAEGIALIPIAADALRKGDDCHGKTPEATRILVSEISERTPGGIQDQRSVEFMHGSPSLFLNLWMAATKCAMLLAEGVEGSGMVTAAAGNGNKAGIQISGLPGRWFTATALPPRGNIEGGLPDDRALGAIGDSAVVDAFGLGAMAFHLAESQLESFKAHLPADLGERRRTLSLDSHVGFRNLDLALGISAHDVVTTGTRPIISLGILDKLGEAGRIGGGIYEMPLEPFAAAMKAVEEAKTNAT